ncbi:MAG TPA: hypothetical protein VFY19_00645 [Geminicoccaceae bacterium]|nr:hypothetical protein [Geminicoccaceae bacterium]
MRPYAPPRFEYRIWGEAFPALPAPDRETVSREVYLLPAAGAEVNVKLRGDALEVKRLLGTRAGLQEWLPALRCPLPLPAAVIEQDLCPALGAAPPRLMQASYPLERFLDEVASALAGVRVVALDKQRRAFEVAGSRAERTRVKVGEVTLESVAVEAERFEAAAAATDQLGLRRAPNVDYVSALGHLLAGRGLASGQPCG